MIWAGRDLKPHPVPSPHLPLLQVWGRFSNLDIFFLWSALNHTPPTPPVLAFLHCEILIIFILFLFQDHYTDKIKASWTGSKAAYVGELPVRSGSFLSCRIQSSTTGPKAWWFNLILEQSKYKVLGRIADTFHLILLTAWLLLGWI